MPRLRWAGRSAIACALLVGVLGGCLPRTDAEHTASWLTRVRGWAGVPSTGEGLFVETALVDQPAPDPFLTRELWDSAVTTNPLTAEQTALLELNGLRVRVTTGIPPARLQTLLTTDGATLSPMARSLRLGQPKVVPVNGPVERLAFAVRRDLKADATPLDADDVECGLSLTARIETDGRIALRCEPQVQSGDRQQFLKPTADGSGFSRQERKPLDTFPTLGWEVTLGPGDYLLVGPTADAAGTLGQGFFYAMNGDRLRQRVLVVRAAHAADSPTAPAKPGEIPLRPTTAAAAAQASGRWTERGATP